MSIKESKQRLNDFISFTQDSREKVKACTKEDVQLNNIHDDLSDAQKQLDYLNRLRFVITGNNKSGKSCLINTILESEILYSNEDSATESVLIIKPVRNKQPTLWRCKLNKILLKNASYITYFEKVDGEVALATGHQEVKFFIKDINIQMKKQGSNEDFYYILEHEIPIFNGLNDEVFNMVELIDCPGLNNHERQKLRKNMIPALFSSLVCFLYVTKIDSYENDSEYKSFEDIMKQSKDYGVLKEEQAFEIVVNKVDCLDGKKDIEKEIILKSIRDYYNKHFNCNKEHLHYSALNELKYMSLETFFRVQYANYEKNKGSFRNFQRYLNSQLREVEDILEENKLIGIIKESESLELTYIADNYTHYDLDYQLLKKYSLIYEYEKQSREPNKLHKLLMRNIDELHKLLIKKVLRKVNMSSNSINTKIDLLLINQDLKFNSLDIVKAKSLRIKIDTTLTGFLARLKDCIRTMEGRIKLEQEKLVNIEFITDVKNLINSLKLFEESTQEIFKSYEDEFKKVNEAYSNDFKDIFDEFYKLIEKVKLAMPENQESYSKICDNSLNYDLPGNPFKALLYGLVNYITIRGIVMGVGAGAGIALMTYAGGSAISYSIGLTLVEAVSIFNPVGLAISAGIFTFCLCKALKDSINERDKNLKYLREQYYKVKDEFDKRIEQQYSEVERLIVKIKRFIDEEVTSAIDLIAWGKTMIMDNIKALNLIKNDINMQTKILNDFIQY
jgi:hypothetical protein